MLLGVGCCVAYARSLGVPFLFDDDGSIARNPTIRHLATALFPPGASSVTVSGRPLLNLSFAINYAIGGNSVWSYHALNLLLHLSAGWILFRLARLTLRAPSLTPWMSTDADAIALATAAVWALHPLNTEAVTYVVQRAESLVSFFYLLTLYCFARSVSPSRIVVRPALWQAMSVAACLCGMASKEVMVSAPVIVLLYDRTFVAGSFARALRSRPRFYLGLAGTWVVLAWLVILSRGRGGSAGFGLGIEGWSYALTQCQAIPRYLGLVIWPHPLVFDYGTSVASISAPAIAGTGAMIGALATTTLALRFRPTLGFLAACVFALLAPSSSVIPIATQTMAEHRMYLAGAVVLASIVVLIRRSVGACSTLPLILCAALFGLLTFQRNGDYRTEETIWRDVVRKCPTNARAHATLALAFYQQRRYGAAVAEDEAALRLSPDYLEARSNLGSALESSGQPRAAIAEFRRVLQSTPNAAEVHCNLANALAQAGEGQAALSEFDRAQQLSPESAELHAAYGDALFNAGRWAEADTQYERALALNAADAVTWQNLGTVRLREGRTGDAIANYDQAVHLAPNLAPAHINLAIALEAAARWPEAIAELGESLALDRSNPLAYEKLGIAQANLGRYAEAEQNLAAALRLQPDQPHVRQEIEVIQAMRAGR